MRIFLSTLSLRRATDDLEPSKTRKLTFLSTLSLRRATARRALGFVDPDISIHALLAESDCRNNLTERLHWHFYPRSPCVARQGKNSGHETTPCISIHALLAESDTDGLFFFCGRNRFLSTLSLRRATPVRDIIQWEGMRFLSTLSLRRAT